MSKSKCNQKNQIFRREDGPMRCHRYGMVVTVKEGKCTNTNCRFSPGNAWTPSANMPGS